MGYEEWGKFKIGCLTLIVGFLLFVLFMALIFERKPF